MYRMGQVYWSQSQTNYLGKEFRVPIASGIHLFTIHCCWEGGRGGGTEGGREGGREGGKEGRRGK